MPRPRGGRGGARGPRAAAALCPFIAGPGRRGRGRGSGGARLCREARRGRGERRGAGLRLPAAAAAVAEGPARRGALAGAGRECESGRSRRRAGRPRFAVSSEALALPGRERGAASPPARAWPQAMERGRLRGRGRRGFIPSGGAAGAEQPGDTPCWAPGVSRGACDLPKARKPCWRRAVPRSCAARVACCRERRA